QRIMVMINTVIEAINEITTNYESLRDQLDHLTETDSIATLRSEQFNTLSSHISISFHTSSSGSSQLSFSNIISTTWNEFKIIFDRIMAENNYSLDDMCNTVSVEIRGLGVGKISKETVLG
ncbi:6335_t:CDS:2, partial [Diversispora eburnea]